MEITNKILKQLKQCKNHNDFIQNIFQIASMFNCDDLYDSRNTFGSTSDFYEIFERILSVVPLSPNDDEVFIITSECIISLIKLNKFLN